VSCKLKQEEEGSRGSCSGTTNGSHLSVAEAEHDPRRVPGRDGQGSEVAVAFARGAERDGAAISAVRRGGDQEAAEEAWGQEPGRDRCPRDGQVLLQHLRFKCG